MRSVEFVVLVDNRTDRPGLLTEHGLSVWVRAPGGNLLFDTGQTADTLARNAELLGIRLEDADACVLSHGHYDHSGGLPHFLEVNRKAKVYACPDALTPHYVLRPGQPPKHIGLSPEAAAALVDHQDRVVWCSRPTDVFPGIRTTGAIPADSNGRTDERFHTDIQGSAPDRINEQSVWVRTERGSAMLFGCLHAGFKKVLGHPMLLGELRDMGLVIGGMHLRNASIGELEFVEQSLNEACPSARICPLHCTGDASSNHLRQRLESRYVQGGVGAVVHI